MKKISFIFKVSLMVMMSLSVENIHAQNNNVDKDGRRQGKWTDYHENGNVRYTGQFENDVPVGEFLYYSEDGKLVARNKYLDDGCNETEIYSADGKLAAKGKYVNKKKEGKWRYYSDKDASLILEEEYENGLRNGKSVVYIPETAAVSEETSYVNDLKDGMYVKYYDNGSVMVKAVYKNDSLDGDYVYYYSNGVVKEEGRFAAGMKVGEWKTYDIEGYVISVDSHEEENYNDPALQDVELNR